MPRDVARPTIVIAAANGFLGRHATAAFLHAGYDVHALARPGRENDAIQHPRVTVHPWDGKTLGPWADTLDGAAAVLNLAGRTVDCIKNKRNIRQIFRSRTDSVRVLGEACRAVINPPPVWLQAGTAHILGDPDPPDTICDDNTQPPDFGMAPKVGLAWEAALQHALLPNQRGVMLRISFVLGPDDGALQRLVPLTKAFLGGTVGHGNQYMSWLHIEDLNRLWLTALDDARYHGPILATAPNPVTNRVFMRELRRACRRPWSPPAPALGVKLIAPLLMKTDPELALLGRRILPTKLQQLGFTFNHPELRPALTQVMSQWQHPPALPAQP